jgi:hypothetical protein
MTCTAKGEVSYVAADAARRMTMLDDLPTFMYHGTTKEATLSILQNGFRPNSYFTIYMDSALVMGGLYLFKIWFHKNEHPNRGKNWQYVSPIAVPKERIVWLRNFSQEIIYKNEPAEIEAKKECHSKLYPNKEFCDNCQGLGQLEKYDEFAGQWRNNLPVTTCPVCQGHGVKNRWEGV